MRKSLLLATLASALIVFTACAQPTEPTAPTTVTVTPAQATTPTPASSVAPQPLTMPDVSGLLLDDAYKQLTAMGVDVLPNPVDGHAFAVNYANWKVVAQNPTAGATIASGDRVEIDVVKTSEAENSYCGDNDC